jgi:hypothetical protein
VVDDEENVCPPHHGSEYPDGSILQRDPTIAGTVTSSWVRKTLKVRRNCSWLSLKKSKLALGSVLDSC